MRHLSSGDTSKGGAAKGIKTPRGSVQIAPHAKGFAVRVVSRTEAYTTYYSNKQRAERHFRHYRDLFTGGNHAS